MKVTQEKLPESLIELNVEVESEAVNKAMDKAYRRLVNKMNIPGFRRGKAPRHVVERMVGTEGLWQEGIEDMLPSVYQDALKETDIHPIDEPQIDIVQQEPLVIKFLVPVRPEFELPEYKEVRVPRIEVAINEADIDATLEQIREGMAEWVTVERPAKEGDQLRADVEGWVGATPLLYGTTGETLVRSSESETLIDSKDIKIWVSPESKFPVAGFSEKMVDAKAGDVKEFTLTLPEDYPQEKYAGRSIVFKVNVHEVMEKSMPQLDDELAKKLGEFESIEAVRENLRQQLQHRAEHDAEHQLEDAVMGTIVDKTTIELPPPLVNHEIDRLVRNLANRLASQNVGLDQYLKIVNKSEEELREELRGDAIRNLKTTLVLDKIADNEGVVVSSEEVDKRIEEVVEALGEEGAKAAALLRRPDRREDLMFEMRTQKTIERLVEMATQEEKGAEGAEEKTSEEKSSTDTEEQPGAENSSEQ